MKFKYVLVKREDLEDIQKYSKKIGDSNDKMFELIESIVVNNHLVEKERVKYYKIIGENAHIVANNLAIFLTSQDMF